MWVGVVAVIFTFSPLMVSCSFASLDCMQMTRKSVTTKYGLMEILNSTNINNVCIQVDCEQFINESIYKVGVSNLLIIGNNHTFKCDENVGFSFGRCNNIDLKEINFIGCGTAFTSTVSIFNTTSKPFIYSALYFRQTRNVMFTKVKVYNSSGYGIVMYDCGGKLLFYQLKIGYNTLVPHKVFQNGSASVVKGYASGGGLYIEYTHNVSTQYTRNNLINVSFCNFEFNIAEQQEPTMPADTIDGRNPFGRGAGISFFLFGNASHNKFYVENTNISYNKALWGAGLYIEFSRHSESNAITVDQGWITGNNAILSGGGVFVYATPQLNFLNNIVNVHAVHFLHNSAQIGGSLSGYSVPYPNFLFKQIHNKMNILNCTFKMNQATLGAAVYLEAVSVLFSNNLIENNNKGVEDHFKSDLQKLAAFYSYHGVIRCTGDNLFVGNLGTALVLDFSNLYATKNLTFLRNVGINGGGMAFYQHSQIYIMDSTAMRFEGNNATKGGAIYLLAPGVPLELWETPKLLVYNCFIHGYSEKFGGRVEFIGNLAHGNDGNAIFATSLQHCQNSSGNDIASAVRTWKNFDFSQNEAPVITTDPVQIVVVNDTQWRSIYPGKFFVPDVWLLDEQNNSVSANVLIAVQSNSSKIKVMNELIQHVVSNGDIGFTLIANTKRGEKFEKFSVTLSSPQQKAPPSIVSQIVFKDCPFGYSFEEKKHECICITNQARGVTQCIGTDIYLTRNMWAKRDQNGTNEVIIPCPEGYCTNCSSAFGSGLSCLYKPQKQCAEGRDQNSPLCSQCLKGYTVKLGSEECVKECPSHTGKGFMLVVLPIVAIIIVLIVLWTNIDVYYNYLNSVLFFYQVAYLIRTPDQVYKFASNYLFRPLNLDGFSSLISFCILNKMDNLGKIHFTLACLDISLITIVLLMVCGGCCHKRLSLFSKRKCFNALVLVMMYGYGNITKIVVFLFNTVYIDKGPGMNQRLFVYADVERAGNAKYIFTIIFAGLNFVFVTILFPVLLLIPELILRCKSKWFIDIYKPCIDNFNKCYKQDMISQRFSAYYFFWRMIFLMVYALYPIPLQQEQLTLFACFSIICLVGFAIAKPYEADTRFKWLDLNVFDLLVLLNLTLIALLTNGKRKLYAFDPWNYYLEKMIDGFMWPPAVIPLCCLGHFIWMKCCKRFCEEKRNTKGEGESLSVVTQPRLGFINQEQPGSSSNNEEQPGPSSNNEEQPLLRSSFEEQPGPSNDIEEQPGPGSNNEEQSGPSSNNEEQPGLGSSFEEQPGPSSNNEEQPGLSSNDNDEQPGSTYIVEHRPEPKHGLH